MLYFWPVSSSSSVSRSSRRACTHRSSSAPSGRRRTSPWRKSNRSPCTRSGTTHSKCNGLFRQNLNGTETRKNGSMIVCWSFHTAPRSGMGPGQMAYQDLVPIYCKLSTSYSHSNCLCEHIRVILFPVLFKLYLNKLLIFLSTRPVRELTRCSCDYSSAIPKSMRTSLFFDF